MNPKSRWKHDTWSTPLTTIMPRRRADIPLIIDRLPSTLRRARACRPTTATRARRPLRRLGLEPILTFPAAVPSCRPRKLRAPYPAHRDGRGPCIMCDVEPDLYEWVLPSRSTTFIFHIIKIQAKRPGIPTKVTRRWTLDMIIMSRAPASWECFDFKKSKYITNARGMKMSYE